MRTINFVAEVSNTATYTYRSTCDDLSEINIFSNNVLHTVYVV